MKHLLFILLILTAGFSQINRGEMLVTQQAAVGGGGDDGEPGGGGTPPGDFSTAFFLDWQPSSANGGDTQGLKVKVYESNLKNAIGSLYGTGESQYIVINSVTANIINGSGLVDHQMPFVENGSSDYYEYVYSNVPDNNNVTAKIKVSYTHQAHGGNDIKFSGAKSETIGDKTAPPSSPTPSVSWVTSSPNSGATQSVNVNFSYASEVAKVKIIRTNSTGASNYSESDFLVPSTTSYTEAVSHNSTHYYKVRSFDLSNNYRDSSPQSVIVPKRTAPTASPAPNVAHIIVENDYQNQKVSYTISSANNPDGGALNRIRLESADSIYGWHVFEGLSGAITQEISGITDGQEIDFRFRLEDADGNFSYSPVTTLYIEPTFVETTFDVSYSGTALNFTVNGIGLSSESYSINTSPVRTGSFTEGNATNESFTLPTESEIYLDLSFIDRVGNHIQKKFRIIETETFDDLTFNYSADGKKHLTSVTDDGTDRGYTDKGGTYEYDANGNVTKDLNKDIETIEYNHLNLPVKITFKAGTKAFTIVEYGYNGAGQRTFKKEDGKLTTKYIRDAEGNLLSEITFKTIIKFDKSGTGTLNIKDVTNNSTSSYPTDVTDAIEVFDEKNFEITADTEADITKLTMPDVQLVYTNILGAGGEVLGKHSESNSEDVFYLKDHLGNVRVTFKNNSGTAEVVSAQEYYPFGMVSRKFVNASAFPEAIDKFKYQGKERDVETNYDYFEARFYDSSIGRFLQVDPMAEKFETMNPFMGMFNNPIRIVDPTGMEGKNGDEDEESEKKRKEEEEAKKYLKIGFKQLLASLKLDFGFSMPEFTSKIKGLIETNTKLGGSATVSIQLDPENLNLVSTTTSEIGVGTSFKLLDGDGKSGAVEGELSAGVVMGENIDDLETGEHSFKGGILKAGAKLKIGKFEIGDTYTSKPMSQSGTLKAPEGTPYKIASSIGRIVKVGYEVDAGLVQKGYTNIIIGAIKSIF